MCVKLDIANICDDESQKEKLEFFCNEKCQVYGQKFAQEYQDTQYTVFVWTFMVKRTGTKI